MGMLLAVGMTTATSPISASVITSNIVNQPAQLKSSLNWSGYADTGGTFTGVSGTWTIPNVSTSTDAYGVDATWVGIGGVLKKDLIQAGTQTITAPDGTVEYQVWYEMLPAISKTVALAVKPGDSVTTTITKGTGNNWTIAIIDNTTKKSFTKSVAYASSLTSAEWVEEMPLTNIPSVMLDNFGTIKFTSGWVIENGTKNTLYTTGAQNIVMKNIFGQNVATTSPVTSDNSFTITRTDAASTSPSMIFRFSGRGRFRITVNNPVADAIGR